MIPYRLDVVVHDSENGWIKPLGSIVIEVPETLRTVPGSNEIDMRAVLLRKDLWTLKESFGVVGRSSRLSFHLSSFTPNKIEYPDPAPFKTESGFGVWPFPNY